MAALNEKVLEYMKCTHAALDTAKAAMDKQASTATAVEGLIKSAVDALIAHSRIDPNDREKAAALLRDPVSVIKLLIKTADTNITIAPKPLGTPQPAEKVASTRSRYTGEKTSEKTAAALRFEEALLGPR